MDAVIKVHTDTDLEKPGLTWIPVFMMPRIISPKSRTGYYKTSNRSTLSFRFVKDKVRPE